MGLWGRYRLLLAAAPARRAAAGHVVGDGVSPIAPGAHENNSHRESSSPAGDNRAAVSRRFMTIHGHGSPAKGTGPCLVTAGNADRGRLPEPPAQRHETGCGEPTLDRSLG